MKIEELHQIMKNLSKNRPFFLSEDDFKLALFSEIALQTNSYKDIRMEKFFNYEDNKNNQSGILNENNPNIYIDGFIKSKKIGIELKYKTKIYEFDDEGEIIVIKEHGARDLGRFHFRKDIYRLEQLKKNNKISKGLAIFLTNDSSYKNGSNKNNSIDKEFCISNKISRFANWNHNLERLEKNGYKLNNNKQWHKNGKLHWTHKGDLGMSLKLSKDYHCDWRMYSDKFCYLVIEV